MEGNKKVRGSRGRLVNDIIFVQLTKFGLKRDLLHYEGITNNFVQTNIGSDLNCVPSEFCFKFLLSISRNCVLRNVEVCVPVHPLGESSDSQCPD